MSRNYFNCLNYTLANEDTSLELNVLPKGVPHLMSVAGSGGRVLPLLAKAPKRVSCVDLSKEQLYLTELRFESLRTLDHSEFLSFWGYPPAPCDPEKRKLLFGKIRLKAPSKEFLRGVFESLGWESLLYTGRWEKTVTKLASVNRRITGLSGIGLFSNLTRTEHFRYLEKRFPTYAWATTISVLGNASVFNALLYKGHFPKKNIPESSFRFYQQAFQRIFQQGPARENFLLQLMFFGKILFPEGNPIECDAEVFKLAKKGLEKAEIRYIQGNIIEESKNSNLPVDLLSLSDVPSYFSGTIEKQFMQDVRQGMSPQGLVVVRNYLRVPVGTDLSGFERVTSKYEEWIEKEKVQLYKIDIFKKEKNERSRLQ